MPDFGGGAPPVGVAPAKGLLRVLTCGSVDDGKSTLIGRLLVEAGSIPTDSLETLARDSRRAGGGEELDYSLLLDGLEAEREQGITIDVAYRFFSTDKRAFIVADTPGHEQYTRNMATGASTADVAILLVDARKGLSPQTRRHAAIVSLLGVREVILAVNKMDLVGWSRATFEAIARDFSAVAAPLAFTGIHLVPLSAKRGDNLRTRSAETPWYDGPTLLHLLETLEPASASAVRPFRFPVQRVARHGGDFRGLQGVVASGDVRPGDAVVAAESGREALVSRIVAWGGDLDHAGEGEAVTLVLDRELDISRGALLTAPRSRAQVADALDARLIWMDEAPLAVGRTYLLKLGPKTVPARVTAIHDKLGIDDLRAGSPEGGVGLNAIARVRLSLSEAVAFDAYAENRRTGAFILIDRASHATVAAGLVEASAAAAEVHPQALAVDRGARERLAGHRALCVWLTGLSGSGKSTLADGLERRLHAEGVRTLVLDGDNLRTGLNAGLGFSEADRAENVRRTGEAARLLVESGAVAICALISPFRDAREAVRARFAPGDFVEVFVDTPLEVCAARDPKGLYARAQSGALPGLTGVAAPYEAPESADLHLTSDPGDLERLIRAVLAKVQAA